MSSAGTEEPVPRTYTPFFEAQNASRYERQELIRAYQTKYGCRLIVVSGPIDYAALVFLEELVHEADRSEELHVMLTSPGGDGETALRMAKSLQSRCSKLVVLIPESAKSAATLIALAAHQIQMGPFGDLGPIDPQLMLPGQTQLTSAKDIVSAVEDATARIQAAPESYPFIASLFSNLNGLIVEQAKSALGRTRDQLREALSMNPERSKEDVATLVVALEGRLITEPKSHAALFGAADAKAAGLPIEELEPSGEQWHDIWRLWSRYAVLGRVAVFEGERASQIRQL